MKVGKNEKSLVLSSTDIPDIFFTEYLPEASGDPLYASMANNN